MVGLTTLDVDTGPTPMQTREVPLVETQLHAVNTLVQPPNLVELGWLWGALAALVAALPLGMAAAWLGPLPGALVGASAPLLHPLLALELFARFSLRVPFAAFWTFLLGAYLGLLAFDLLVVERARREARQRFGRFFPAQVVEAILADPEGPRLGGRKAELTILFSDIKGFTTTSEQVDPDLLAEFLGAYFERMVEVVFRHGGTVDKFMGDGLMAFWGDPVPHRDHAQRALDAAVEMQRAAREVDAEWGPRLEAPVRIRVGLNTGKVTVGNMGGSQRMEYTVLGRAVNLAQRLEAGASPGAVLVGQTTWERLDRPPQATPREIRAKGIAEPVRAHEVSVEGPGAGEE